MRVKGALHVHSKLSRDGTLTIRELVEWYGRKGYQFLALGEHAEDLDDDKVQALRAQSSENSNDAFCVLGGIEFVSKGDIHIVGIGVSHLIRENDPLAVAAEIHKRGGVAVLAHPKRIGWECPPEVLLALDAIEIWNVGYDGKYLPSVKALSGFRRMQEINPKLLAVASHDFHRTGSFYDVAIEMDVAALSADAILQNLRQGSYRIRSSFFRADPAARLSSIEAISIGLLSRQLATLRKAREFFLRWSS